jgi:hypothetical protein
MTMLERGIAGVEHPFGLGRKVSDGVSLWLSVLGALAISGYLMFGHPAATVESAAASAEVAQDQPARSSVVDAALGTVLAAGWLATSAWLGIRSARSSTPLDDSDPRSGFPFGQLGKSTK